MFRPESDPNFFKNNVENKDEVSLDKLRGFYSDYVEKNIERNKIDEEDFVSETDPEYSPQRIERDKAKVKEFQEIFQKSLLTSTLTPEEKENQEKLDILAKEFEAICSDHTVLSRAFNLNRGEIQAQSASDYDDIIHKTDLLIEFPREKGPNKKIEQYAFGIDVTISKNNFKKKFNELYGRFANSPGLNEVKYFQESAHNIRDARIPHSGKVKIPRYIINAKPEEMLGLMEGWKMWKDNFNTAITTKEKNELLDKTKLAKSKLWYRILYQLELQALTFARYFEKSHPQLTDIYRQNYMMFRKHRSGLVMKYIGEDEEMNNKLSEIAREKEGESKTMRLAHLHKNIHNSYKGEDMGYLAKIIKDELK